MKYVAETTAPKPKMTPIATPALPLPDRPDEDDADADDVEVAIALGVGVPSTVDVAAGFPPFGH